MKISNWNVYRDTNFVNGWMERLGRMSNQSSDGYPAYRHQYPSNGLMCASLQTNSNQHLDRDNNHIVWRPSNNAPFISLLKYHKTHWSTHAVYNLRSHCILWCQLDCQCLRIYGEVEETPKHPIIYLYFITILVYVSVCGAAMALMYLRYSAYHSDMPFRLNKTHMQSANVELIFSSELLCIH